MSLSEEDRQKILTWAKRHPVIERIWLFGSQARGEATLESDIDLAVEMDFLSWFDWHPKYVRETDLVLSHPVQLEWYRPNVGLEVVGKGVREDGKLIYERERGR